MRKSGLRATYYGMIACFLMQSCITSCKGPTPTSTGSFTIQLPGTENVTFTTTLGRDADPISPLPVFVITGCEFRNRLCIINGWDWGPPFETPLILSLYTNTSFGANMRVLGFQHWKTINSILLLPPQGPAELRYPIPHKFVHDKPVAEYEWTGIEAKRLF